MAPGGAATVAKQRSAQKESAPTIFRPVKQVQYTEAITLCALHQAQGSFNTVATVSDPRKESRQRIFLTDNAGDMPQVQLTIIITRTAQLIIKRAPYAQVPSSKHSDHRMQSTAKGPSGQSLHLLLQSFRMFVVFGHPPMVRKSSGCAAAHTHMACMLLPIISLAI
eukprot:1158158-Pelagomonas_calceolata.AAC.2